MLPANAVPILFKASNLQPANRPSLVGRIIAVMPNGSIPVPTPAARVALTGNTANLFRVSGLTHVYLQDGPITVSNTSIIAANGSSVTIPLTYRLVFGAVDDGAASVMTASSNVTITCGVNPYISSYAAAVSSSGGGAKAYADLMNLQLASVYTPVDSWSGAPAPTPTPSPFSALTWTSDAAFWTPSVVSNGQANVGDASQGNSWSVVRVLAAFQNLPIGYVDSAMQNLILQSLSDRLHIPIRQFSIFNMSAAVTVTPVAGDITVSSTMFNIHIQLHRGILLTPFGPVNWNLPPVTDFSFSGLLRLREPVGLSSYQIAVKQVSQALADSLQRGIGIGCAATALWPVGSSLVSAPADTPPIPQLSSLQDLAYP